jgi:hypothetical protein
MADYVYASVIIEAADQSVAQAFFGSDAMFVFGLSEDGSAPATHYVTAGPYDAQQLADFLNDAVCPCWVHFGETPDYNGLLPVAEPEPEPALEPVA